MREVASHRVDEWRMAYALDGISERTRIHWEHWYDGLSLGSLQEMCDGLLDHLAARIAEDPELCSPDSAVVLRTAAECALGALSLGAFPNGDQEVPLPLIDEMFSSEVVDYRSLVDQAPTARTWRQVFSLCLISGPWERDRVIGGLLLVDYAPTIREGVPHSPLESQSDPADIAEMDALCIYLVGPWQPNSSVHGSSLVLRKPDADERAEAARQLDAVGPLTSDQQLLRTLLEDDRSTFEHALTTRLTQYRDNAAVDAPPRSLLPFGTIALVKLAIRVHGWELGIGSNYLPARLLHGE
ncbi:immunity 49 family protein [Nocardia uniformis]|uniref:Immunity 49 family protein n=1 Tax=Nocardia uniformis TaxID=53432 RepID=A0A849CL10_9NOCA|nr:immunity 49 family protein [Nocardia uniformis]NNH75971.1 immunity 49 family protein [Nocardia uniformis]